MKRINKCKKVNKLWISLLLFVGIFCIKEQKIEAAKITENGFVFEADYYNNTAVVVDYTGTNTYEHIPISVDGCTVVEIGENAFKNEKDIKTLIIPDTVTRISSFAFSGGSFESVTIPSSVTYIGVSAFSDSNLVEIQVPSSVTKLEDDTFKRCYNLEKVELPNTLQELGGSVFRECVSLETITIPDSVKVMGGYVFFGCDSLTDISISNSCSRIESYAFYGCTALKTITIPDSNVI